MVAPAVLGTLGKQQAAQGLDASGLAQLLASQKENISAALPSGFGDMLRASGVPGFGTAGAQAPQTARASLAKGETPQTSSWRWVLGAVAAAALAWWVFGNRPAEVVEQTKTTAGQVVQTLSVDGVDLKSSLQSALAGLKTAVQDVTDAASAQAALPQLEKGAAQFDRIRELSAKLPAESKSALATLITTARPALEGLFDKVLTIPGVDAIVKPAIDALRVKLNALSKA
jgi:hypothetical protein